MKNFLLVPALFALSTLAAQAAPTFTLVNNCTETDYVLVEAATVEIGVESMQFTPRCLKVRPGTRVTIEGSSVHPLQGSADVQSVSNPFRQDQGSKVNVTQVLNDEGFYGYFCTRHASMKGSILVTKD